MKVLVAHNKSGKIISVGIPTPSSDKRVTPRTSKGQLVAELDIPNVELGAKDLADRLGELHTKFKIRINPRGPELVGLKE